MIRFVVLVVTLLSFIGGCAKHPVALSPAQLREENDVRVLFDHWVAYSGGNQSRGVATLGNWESREEYAQTVRKHAMDIQRDPAMFADVNPADRPARMERISLILSNQVQEGWSPNQVVWAWGSPEQVDRRQSTIGAETWMYWRFSGGYFRRTAYFRNDQLLYFSDEP